MLEAYDTLLRKRGDVNGDGFTDGADVLHLHANFGGTGSLTDRESTIRDLNRTPPQLCVFPLEEIASDQRVAAIS